MRRTFYICLVIIVVMSVLYLVAPNAWGQTKIALYSSNSKPGMPPASDCVQAEAVLIPLLVKFNAPRDWTWIVVCDEAAWGRVEQHAELHRQNQQLGLILGASFLPDRLTYVRGYYLLHQLNPFDVPEHIIAHELGHIMLNTSNEDKADKKASELMKSVALVASK